MLLFNKMAVLLIVFLLCLETEKHARQSTLFSTKCHVNDSGKLLWATERPTLRCREITGLLNFPLFPGNNMILEQTVCVHLKIPLVMNLCWTDFILPCILEYCRLMSSSDEIFQCTFHIKFYLFCKRFVFGKIVTSESMWMLSIIKSPYLKIKRKL